MERVTNQSLPRSFVFDQWVLQSDGLLMHNGNGLHLPPKELHVLRLLLESAGALVSKDYMLAQVWPNCDVAEESLTRCICALRKLLGRKNDYINTVYGKGYRFIGDVTRPELYAQSSSVPSLLVLPLTLQGGDSSRRDLQSAIIRQLAATFGESLCVMPSGLTAGVRAEDDCLALLERISPDYYLGLRCVVEPGSWSLSVELVRGSDHAVLYSEAMTVEHWDKVLLQLTGLVAQRLPGLRPVTSACHSHSMAQAYLNGVLGLQAYTEHGLGEAQVAFLHCLQLDTAYAPPWCGLVDTYLAMANLGLLAYDKALSQARQALAQALALEPANVQVVVRLALLTSLQGSPEAGEALFRPALLGGCDQAMILYHYAWHQRSSGQHQQALQTIESSLAKDPSRVAAWLLCTRAALELDPGYAAVVIEKAVAVLGEQHEVLNAMRMLIWDSCEALPIVQLTVAKLGGCLLGVLDDSCYIPALSEAAQALRPFKKTSGVERRVSLWRCTYAQQEGPYGLALERMQA